MLLKPRLGGSSSVAVTGITLKGVEANSTNNNTATLSPAASVNITNVAANPVEYDLGTATVAPQDASNQTITWSIDGVTNNLLSGGLKAELVDGIGGKQLKLSIPERKTPVTLPENVTVVARIADGVSQGTPFVANFVIPVQAPTLSKDNIVLINGSNELAEGAAITLDMSSAASKTATVSAFLNPTFTGKNVTLSILPVGEGNASEFVNVQQVGSNNQWTLTGVKETTGDGVTLKATVDGVEKTWKVKVVNSNPAAAPEVTGISVAAKTENAKADDAKAGDEFELTATLKDGTTLGENDTITWTKAPENTDYVKITPDGTNKLKAVAKVEKGNTTDNDVTVKITAKVGSEEGGETNIVIKAATPKPTVTGIGVEGIEKDGVKPSTSAAKNGETFTATATVEPDLQSGQSVKWTLKNGEDSVASIDGVASIAAGSDTKTATVTIANNAQTTSEQKLTIQAQVVSGTGENQTEVSAVKEQADAITIAATEQPAAVTAISATGDTEENLVSEIEQGGTITLTATGTALDGKTIEWSISGADTPAEGATGTSLSPTTGNSVTLTIGENEAVGENKITVKAWVQGVEIEENSKVSRTFTVTEKVEGASLNADENAAEASIAPASVMAVQKAAARKPVVQQVQQPQQPYVVDITLPTQRGEVGKDFDLSKASVESVGDKEFSVDRWELARGFADTPDNHTVRMDRAGSVTMRAVVDGGQIDGGAFMKEFEITFVEPQPEEIVAAPAEKQESGKAEQQEPKAEEPKEEVKQEETKQEEIKVETKPTKQEEIKVEPEEEQEPEQEETKPAQTQQNNVTSASSGTVTTVVTPVQKVEVPTTSIKDEPKEPEPVEKESEEVEIPEQKEDTEQQEVENTESKTEENNNTVVPDDTTPEENVVTPVETPVTPTENTVTTPSIDETQQPADATTQTTPAQPEDMSIIISVTANPLVQNEFVLSAGKKMTDGTISNYTNTVWSIVDDGGTLSTLEKNVLKASHKGDVIVKVTIGTAANGTLKIRTHKITIK